MQKSSVKMEYTLDTATREVTLNLDKQSSLIFSQHKSPYEHKELLIFKQIYDQAFLSPFQIKYSLLTDKVQSHLQLVKALKSLLDSYTITVITPPTVYKGYRDLLIRLLNDICEYMLNEKAEIVVYSRQAEVEYILELFQGYRKDEYAFMLNKQYRKWKIEPRLQGVLTDKIIEVYHEQLNAIFQNTQTYLVNLERYSRTREDKGLKGEYGLKMELEGIDVGFFNLHQKLTDFFEGQTVTIISLSKLEICKINDVEKHFADVCRMRVLEKRNQMIEIAVFGKDIDIQSVSSMLKRSQFLINSQHFSQDKLKELYEGREEIERQFQGKVTFTEKNILLVGERANYQRFMMICKTYLASNTFQEHQCKELNTPFEINLFIKHHKGTATYFSRDSRLFRKNKVKFEAECKEEYQREINKLFKSIVTMYTLKPPRPDSTLSISMNPQKCKKKYLCGKRFRIENGHGRVMALSTMNYASIVGNFQMMVLMIDHDKISTDALDLLKDTVKDLTQSAAELRDFKLNSLCNYETPRSPHFNKLLVWIVDMRDQAGLHKNIKILLKEVKQSKIMRILIDTVLVESRVSALLMEKLIDQLFNRTLVDEDCYLEEAILYSFQEPVKLVEAIKCVGGSLQVGLSVNLLLGARDIDKICGLHYYRTPYFHCQEAFIDPEKAIVTHQLSPLNSFIFNNERSRLKNMKVPVMVPKGNETSVEYLVCIPTQEVYVIRKKALAVREQMKPELQAIVKLLARYFTNMEYIVGYSNEDGSLFSNEVYFYQVGKILQRLQLQMDVGKCMVKKQGPLQVGFVDNDNAVWYEVKGHKKDIAVILAQ